MVQNLTIKNTP